MRARTPVWNSGMPVPPQLRRNWHTRGDTIVPNAAGPQLRIRGYGITRACVASGMTNIAPTNIGIIGAGNIGGTLASRLVELGHRVTISNSRGPETLEALVAELGPNAKAGTPEEAAEVGEFVIVTVPFRAYRH